MSEEELKVIERFKKIKEETDIANRCGLSTNDFKEDLETYDAILNLIEKQQKEIENIKKEVQEHIAFENRLKRDGTEPDLFNQGRFYVANNIKDILDGKEKI